MNLQELMNSTGQANNSTNEIGGGFDVLNTINKENQDLMQSFRDVMYDRFKQRSDMRKNIKLGKVTTGNKENDNKTVKTSELADTFTDAMVFLGKDPQYMLDTYGSSEGNINLINKVKGLQGGKYSGDIQNYIDGKSNDLTGLVNNIFPTYVSGGNFEQDRANKSEQTTTQNIKGQPKGGIEGYSPSVRDKIVNFNTQDIGLEKDWTPVKDTLNVGGGFVDTTQKIIPGAMDLFTELTKMSPENFNEELDNGRYYVNGVKKNALVEYTRDMQNGYKGDYNQWIKDKKDNYAKYYDTITNTRKTIDDSRGDWWFNTMDTDSNSFKAGQLGSEVVQQVVLDKWLKNALGEGYKMYQGSKNVKNATKGTELATKSSELAAPGTDLANPALATIKNADGTINPEVVKETKNIANKIMDWATNSSTLRGSKDAMEFQLIGDIQDGKLSDAQAYGINAGIGGVLGLMFGLGRKGTQVFTDPKESIQTSLKRLGVKDTEEIVNLAETAAKDKAQPSALQTVTKQTIDEAKENAVKIRDEAGTKLGDFRKSLPNDANANIETDLLNPLNESITKKGIGGKIVFKDGVATVEGNPGQYKEALQTIADKINSIKTNLEQKLELQAKGTKVDIPSSTEIYEEIYQDLKRVSYNEKDNAVKRTILDIQKDMLDGLKKNMTPEQVAEYETLLKNYSDAATRVSKIEEAESKMLNRNTVDQGIMSDGTYLSDFLTELERDNIITKNASDRRILAIFSDALYGVPVKESDKTFYPSFNGMMEALMRLAKRKMSSPKGVKVPLVGEVGGGWKKWNYDYEPAIGTKIVGGAGKVGLDTSIGKAANAAADNGED